MRSSSIAWVLSFAVVGCSTRSEPRPWQGGDALSRARAIPLIGERLRPVELLRDGRVGLVPSDAVGTLRFEIPRTARAPLRVAHDDQRFIEIVAEHDADVAGRVDGGAILYENASKDVDSFIVAETDHVEDIRVLRGPSASSIARWRVRLSPALTTLTVNGNVVEARDAAGRAWLRTDPIFAVDARGVTRVPSVTITRDGVAFALVATLDTKGLEYPIAIDPGWGTTAAMSTPRMRFASTKLADGRVFTAGGQGELTATGVLSSAEIYDSASKTWSTVAPMKVPRAWHALVTLADGKVMALGGITTGSCVEAQSTEVYDPALGTWTDGPALPKKWYQGRALTIPGNRVVIFGGRPCVSTGDKTTNILDVAAGTWTVATGLLQTDRQHLGASLLGNGKILVTGGRISVAANVNSTGEIFDPATSTVTVAPAMSVPRVNHAQVTLADGRALIIGGGNDDTNLSGAVHFSSEIFDPATSTWALVPINMAFRHNRAPAALLTNGKVVVGPGDLGTGAHFESEIYDPVTNAWSSAGKMLLSRGSYQIQPLGGGSAVLFGGDAHNPNGGRVLTASAEILADGVVAGGACGSGGQCASGFCADAVCCDAVCTGKCQTCIASGTVGTCTSLAAPPAGKGVCDPYVCGAVDCKAACTADSDCIATSYCNTTTTKCEPRVDSGTACTTASQCKSGFCADGRCCNTACDAGCESCNESGSLGTCTKLNGVADKHAKCPTGECTTTCVAGACGFKSATTSCGTTAATCSGCTLTTSNRCSGTDERCVMGATAPCPGGLKCADATTCTSKCSKDADCVIGTCDLASGACTSAADAGTDAPVADTAVADLGVAMGSTRLPDQPSVAGEFSRCSRASECASGHCVEGICCDTACDQKCYSCALITSPGKCTVSPIGVDLRNDCGPALQCLGTCDGTGQCIGAGSGTMCSRNRCTGQGNGVGPAYCAAPGAKCDTSGSIPFDCAPYVCEPAFGACRTACATSLDCVNGFVCDAPTKTCVAASIPPAEDGGCAMGRTGGRTTAALVVLLGLLGAKRRRARR